jgi:hypothetical protein
MSKRVTLILTVLLTVSSSCLSAVAQITDGASFSELSLRAILSVSPSERRGARRMLAQQIGFLPPAWRVAAADHLFAKLRAVDPRNRTDVLFVLGEMPSPWDTKNTVADSDFLYQLVQQISDDTLRILTDTALANARGLYKDGLLKFNTTILSELVEAEPKLRAMADKYPKSRYAERGSFYLAQYYSKRFVLKDPAGKALITSSNTAYEDYIKKAESNFFGTKEYLPGGYYYRALNGWLAGDINDATKWLNLGLKFTDEDQVYIYQIFVTKERAAVIDRWLPAKSVFSKTLAFLNQRPTPSVDRAIELAGTLRIE